MFFTVFIEISSYFDQPDLENLRKIMLFPFITLASYGKTWKICWPQNSFFFWYLKNIYFCVLVSRGKLSKFWMARVSKYLLLFSIMYWYFLCFSLILVYMKLLLSSTCFNLKCTYVISKADKCQKFGKMCSTLEDCESIAWINS